MYTDPVYRVVTAPSTEVAVNYRAEWPCTSEMNRLKGYTIRKGIASAFTVKHEAACFKDTLIISISIVT